MTTLIRKAAAVDALYFNLISCCATLIGLLFSIHFRRCGNTLLYLCVCRQTLATFVFVVRHLLPLCLSPRHFLPLCSSPYISYLVFLAIDTNALGAFVLIHSTILAFVAIHFDTFAFADVLYTFT